MILFGCSLAILLSASLLLFFGSSSGLDALLKALHLLANFNLYFFNSFLASRSFPCKITCYCLKSRSCLSNLEILSSALCFSNWKSSLFKDKCECNSEHSDVFRVRYSCSCEIETCKTGQFSQMKWIGLPFHFVFLAVGSPSQFLLTSGVLGNKRFTVLAHLVFTEFWIFYFSMVHHHNFCWHLAFQEKEIHYTSLSGFWRILSLLFFYFS